MIWSISTREAMLKKSIATVLMGSIFLQKNTSHMTKSLQPWKIRDFHLSFGVKGEFPNPEAFYSFSLLTKNPPRVLKPKFCFFHPEVQGREIGKLRSWSWSLHERSLGKPFFCQGLNPKFGVKPNLEGFFPTKQARRLQLVDVLFPTILG